MGTFTAAAAQPRIQPKGYHEGVQAVTGSVSITATVSAGDVFIMAKIPNKSRILAIQRNFAAGAGNDWVGAIGLQGSLSAFGTANGATGAVGWAAKALPLDISLSDDAVQQHVNVTVQVQSVTSGSATGAISLTVLFTRDLL